MLIKSMKFSNYVVEISTNEVDSPLNILKTFPGLGKAIYKDDFYFLKRHLDVALNNEVLLKCIIEHAIRGKKAGVLIFYFEKILDFSLRERIATFGINNSSLQNANASIVDILAFYGGKISNDKGSSTSSLYGTLHKEKGNRGNVLQSVTNIIENNKMKVDVMKRLIYHGADSNSIIKYVLHFEKEYRECDNDLVNYILDDANHHHKITVNEPFSVELSDYIIVDNNQKKKEFVDIIINALAEISNLVR